MKPTLRKRLSYLLLALLDFASACDREPVDRNSAGNSIFAAEIQPVIMPKNMSALRPFLFALLLAATAAACTFRRIDIGNDITVQRLAEGIYLYTAVDEIEGYGPVPSNGVLIVREGEAVLLDTPVGDAQTKTLTDWAAETLRACVTTFVPNHWHSDCMGGLGYLKTLGVKSYAHRLTHSIAQREGKPVPDIGFGDSLRLDLHGTEIRCYYFGGGHSEDNIAVWIPSAKLLFAGCMVTVSQPVTVQAVLPSASSRRWRRRTRATSRTPSRQRGPRRWTACSCGSPTRGSSCRGTAPPADPN